MIIIFSSTLNIRKPAVMNKAPHCGNFGHISKEIELKVSHIVNSGNHITTAGGLVGWLRVFCVLLYSVLYGTDRGMTPC